MLFNSFEFLFLFFPIVLIGYAICGKLGNTVKGIFLILSSLVFYGWLMPAYVPVLICSMAINYSLTWQMSRPMAGSESKTKHRLDVMSPQEQELQSGMKQRRFLLIAGLVFDIGILVYFKLFSGDFSPLGISFYTFTQIAYLMECYRGNLSDTGIRALDYGLYVTFFPKLLQGPIALPKDMLTQFDRKWKPTWESCYRNAYLFVLGLFKKVLIADTLGQAVDYGYANLAGLNSADALIVMLSFTLQLYFDFSGYCDMAMGITGILGMELPLNFNSPYKAVNILDFWKRWHITLTRFFTKYLYIPLGGNRRGTGRTCLNCLIVFFLSGLWHGMGWQFIIWGMMHGILYVITRLWVERRENRADCGKRGSDAGSLGKAGSEGSSSGKIGSEMLSCGFKRGIGILLTFLYVNVAWIFFRAPSVGEACSLLKTIGSLKFGRLNWDMASCFNLDEFWYVIKILRLDSWQYSHYILMVLILVLVLLLVFFAKTAVDYVKKVQPTVINTVIMAVLFVWSVLSISGVSTFLYVNF